MSHGKQKLDSGVGRGLGYKPKRFEMKGSENSPAYLAKFVGPFLGAAAFTCKKCDLLAFRYGTKRPTRCSKYGQTVPQKSPNLFPMWENEFQERQ